MPAEEAIGLVGHFNYDPIFKATRDGFDEESFVSKCHNKQNILILIQTASNHVLGGYTSKGWTGKNPMSLRYTKDLEAFLLFVRDPNDEGFKPMIKKTRAGYSGQLASYHGYFCYFGGTIWLANNCNMRTDSGIIQYGAMFGSLPANFCLTLGSKFRVKEIEVFHLTDV